MQALVDDQLIDVPAAVLAERERLGLDTRDEVWDGILHMNPPPSNEHSRVQHELGWLLRGLGRPLGLDVRMELGLYNPAHATARDYHVPDITVFSAAVSTPRGADGAAHLAVEVRSPRDDSFKKLPYFEAMGVGEVLIVDRDSTWARHWVRDGDRLVESRPGGERHQLRSVPLVVWSDGERLFTEVDGVVTGV